MHAAAGPTADVSSPKKKKRRKHHDTATQTAPFAASDRAAHSGPFNNTQGYAEHAKPAAKRPTANGPAAVPSEAAATSPAAPRQAAAASTPTADQAAASNPSLQHQQQTSGALEHGFLDPQTGTDTACLTTCWRLHRHSAWQNIAGLVHVRACGCMHRQTLQRSVKHHAYVVANIGVKWRPVLNSISRHAYNCSLLMYHTVT